MEKVITFANSKAEVLLSHFTKTLKNAAITIGSPAINKLNKLHEA